MVDQFGGGPFQLGSSQKEGVDVLPSEEMDRRGGAKGREMKECRTAGVPLCSWSCGGCRSR